VPTGRTIIALATAVAVIVGPQWCCCSLEALTPSIARQTAPAESCCCGPAAPTEQPACPDGAGGRGSCPCRSKPRIAAVDFGWSTVDPVCPMIPSGDHLLFFADVPMPWARQPVPAVGRGRARGGDAALAGRALLRALCVLRC
jgi:hypothetical protein